MATKKKKTSKLEISKEKPLEVETREVPVDFFVPEDLAIQYADNVNLFFSDYDFTLTFLQTQSPLIIRPEDWGKVRTVRSKGIARIVVPPHLIPRIINVLSENWQKFLQVRQQKVQEQENVNATTTTSDNPPAESDKP
jgi:hypothetical protein